MSPAGPTMMSDESLSDTPAAGEGEKKKKDDNFFLFVLKLALFVLIFRSFIFSPFNIPSESMLPTLANGDYLLAAKWPYGYSRYSLPGELPLIPDRILADEPERGDIVIFKHPVDGVDYIKRAIGLPGDTIEMRDGVLFIDGKEVTKERLPDFTIEQSPNTQCHHYARTSRKSDGSSVCNYTRFRETLPNGATYDVLDFGPTGPDNFGPVIVPEGSMFVMGDNRDNSQDSRFDAMPGGGVGIVPQELLVGRASFIMWSTDGSANWLLPWTWFTALRPERLGNGL